MTPALSWLLVGGLAFFFFVVTYALMRAAGRASRMEERMYEVDSSLLALEAYRGRFRGVRDSEAEVPPPDAAA